MYVNKRLPSHIFDLPVQELRRGYRSDIYFWREKVCLERNGLHPSVTMQVFQRQDAVVCGIDEVIAVLKVASGRYRDPEKAYRLFDRLVALKKTERESYMSADASCLEATREKLELTAELDGLWESGFDALDLQALHDGDAIQPWETVMHINGDASLFAHLETIYLGVLARRTRVATNVRRVVEAAEGKTVLFFPARFDHWAVQGGDGYAAHIGGIHGVSTEAQGEWWGARAAGTVPDALVAAMGGNTVEAVRLFGDTFPDVNLVASVDFENDCIRTGLECARALGDRLWGVRIDTSDNMVDQSILPVMGRFKPSGVTPELTTMMRKTLDREGFDHIRIVASGGFTPEKIAAFEACGAPVDAYGVGSTLLEGSYDYTADIVQVDGRPCAKAGRRFAANPRLTPV